VLAPRLHPPGAAGNRRSATLPWLLALPVAALHALLAMWWPADRFGLGDGTQVPARIDVAFVRELAPTAPAAVPAPATRVLRAPRLPASAPASGGEGGTLVPLQVDEALREAAAAAVPEALPEIAPAPDVAAALARSPSTVPPEPVSPVAPASPAVAEGPGAPASSVLSTSRTLPAQSAASAPPAPAFEWPPSTRLSYLLTGNYQGPVEGQAKVEWRLAGERYQVALEVGIGPPFAPLVTRQIQSDGVITATGLEPRRYDEQTHVVLRSPRRLSIVLDADRVLLPSGRQVPRPPGVQDSASQFVQMTWLFTTQPARLLAGSTVEVPLALPRHVETWTYEVLGATTLETPVGAIDAVHVRPRRPPRPPGASPDLVAEFWVAPTLQYLPVRILIRQDEETYVDLHLERLPQQAAPGR